MWYQYTSPGGIAVKIGKFVQDAGARQTTATQWGLDDYVNGARVEFRNSKLNVQVGYGFEDTAAQNNLLYAIPSSSITMWTEADYMVTKQLNVGVQYSNYSGYHSSMWDASAVNCISTAAGAKTGKVIPLTAGQAFTAGGCGAGFLPIVYGIGGANAGLPITGAYIDGTSLTTAPGAQVPHESNIGAFLVGNYGQLHFVLEGDQKQGNDPTTGARWQGNTSGMFEADLGPYVQAPGVRGKWSLNLVAFAAGMNALGPGFDYYQSPNQWVQYSTNFSDYYYASIGVKKFITDTAYVGVWYMNMGLLPNTVIPAGSISCPGCSISGDSRNGLFTEFNLAF
jgi:hypothetical protein